MLLTVEEISKELETKNIDASVYNNKYVQSFLGRLVQRRGFKGFEIEASFDRDCFVVHSLYDSRFMPDVKHLIAKIGDEQGDGAYIYISLVKKNEEKKMDNSKPEVFCSYTPYGAREYHDIPVTRTRKED